MIIKRSKSFLKGESHGLWHYEKLLKDPGHKAGHEVSKVSFEAQESKNEVRKPKPLKSCLTSC